MTDAFIEECLRTRFKVDPQQAQIISRTVDSDFDKALVFLNLTDPKTDVDWIKRRKWLFDCMAEIIHPGLQRITQGLMLSWKLSLDPELTEDHITLMKTFFRDLMIFNLHPKKIVNLDFFDTFSDINQMGEPNVFLKWVHDLYNAEKKLAANCTLRLTLDNFFLGIAGKKGTQTYA
jgi:DNA polymerase-3 subunit delta'